MLWGQVTTAAAVPLALMLCQLGLAVGDPVLPSALEVGLLGALPISVLIWVQWRQPFYPFRLWVYYQAPEALTERQRQWLARLLPMPHQPWLHPHGWLAVVSGWLVYAGFRQLYATAPAVEAVALLPPYLRLLGVLWAVVWVSIATVLLQGAVTAARLLFLAGEEGTPLSIDSIRRNFTFWGQEGGTILKVLGVPTPMDDAGRAVMEPPNPKLSPETETQTPKAFVDEAPGQGESPIAETTAETAAVVPQTPAAPAGEESGTAEPPLAETTAEAAAVAPEIPAAPGEGSRTVEPPIAENTVETAGSETPVGEAPETFGKVAIEPLVTPVFVNVVEDTP